MVPMTASVAGRDSSLIFEEFHMPSNLAKYRHLSFLCQAHRCYYCGFLMWENDLEQFAPIAQHFLGAGATLQMYR